MQPRNEHPPTAHPLAIIWNSKSGSSEIFESLRPRLHTRSPTMLDLSCGEDVGTFIAQSLESGVGTLIVAGGDGTVNCVAEQALRLPHHPPILILPLGTGNDFSRALGIPQSAEEALKLLDAPRIERVDVLRYQSEKQDGFCANMMTGGMSGHALETIDSEMKQRWGALTYARGAVAAIEERVAFPLSLQIEAQPKIAHEAYNLFIANGRSSGGGFAVSGDASIQDGLFDLILVQDASLAKLLSLASQSLSGEGLRGEGIFFQRASRVEIEAPEDFTFTVDGDLLAANRLSVEVVPAALSVYVGPGFASS